MAKPKEKTKETLRPFLEKHAEVKPVSFHMPGHKGSALYKEFGYESFLNNIMDCDITEIPGADNLFQTESVIAEVMKKYRKLYEVKKSYLLVNGSSVGLIASILSQVPYGGKVMMARNSHKSVFNAMTLGGLEPVYLYPEILEDYGVTGEISAKEVESLFDENPEIKAVVVPSPSYYGICSDVKSISEVCHAHNAILIVDQAHGAHLKFMHRFGGELGKDYPMAAEDSGADLVINSTHKTLASWTQTAILNVCSNRVNMTDLEDKLQALESSSPSYPLMASLDINADLLIEHGKELMTRWAENIEYFYSNAFSIPGLEMVLDPMLDGTKLNLDMSAYGLNGNDLELILNKQGIFPELITGNILMCMTGIGNTREDFDKLLRALMGVAVSGARLTEDEKQAPPKALMVKLERAELPKSKEAVKIERAEGKVCAQALIPYPPGIPIVCPGEILTKEVIDYVIGRRKADEKVIGINEKGEILVGC